MLLAGLYSKADEIPTTSKITDVTVFLRQAKETRSATVTIPKGNSDVILSGISLEMIEQSLQVSVKGPGTLITATSRINYFETENSIPKDPKLTRLNDSILVFTKDVAWINEQKAVLNGEMSIFAANSKLGSTQDGLKPAELITLLDFYRTRQTDIRKKLFDLTNKEEKLNEKIQKYQGQIDEMGQKPINPVKEIVLTFSSETGGVLTIRPTYLVNNASWSPMYDIKVINTAQPVNILYKAKIVQNTGFDWKDCKVTISTANPSVNNDRPIMNPRYIDYFVYRVQSTVPVSAGISMNMMQLSAPMAKDAEFKKEDFVDAFDYTAEVSESEINVEFAIDARQTIKSDGKEHICAIQSYTVPATYKYHTVPKLEQAAFLLAKITDYGKYNMLSGPANIFFDEMYIGQTHLNPKVSSDTLLVSLGRDERIVVKRIRVLDKNSKRFIADSQKDVYTWETIIRNNKGTQIDIEVLDQVPLSRRDEIKVELTDKQGAEYTEEFGKLFWNYTVKPNDSKKIRFSYTVEYPKGKTVQEQP
jgi:uncharacterized protein (TIGR02231 family)